MDRAARNIFDYVELERLEADHGLPVIYVAQPTENSPAGRMQRRILSNMASFYTEQQSLDVKEGHARRVQSGLFVSTAPYGYRNLRVDGRGLVEIDPAHAPTVKRIFELYAYHRHTLDSLIARLKTEGVNYKPTQPGFTRSKVHAILRDRAYVGEVEYRGQWSKGSQTPLVDWATWDRVQVLLGEKVYKSHAMTYAGELITCGHCGKPITGELKAKQTKTGEKEYAYYRCSHYNAPGHPRVRVSEADLDQQVLGLFARMRIEDEAVRGWMVKVLQARTRDRQKVTRERREDLQRQQANLIGQQDRLLNLRLLDEIDADTFTAKNAELKERISRLALQIEASDRGQDEHADIAVKAFELSQRLQEKWLAADYAVQRQILEIVCLNFLLDGVSLVPTIRKPFDVLAEGSFVLSTRGERI